MSGEPADKAAIRERVWTALEHARIVPVGVHGHIPDFTNSERAAQRLAELARWRQARTLKANPDRAQQPVRALALADGKLLFMAVPRLAEPHPFLRLDPAALGARPEKYADRAVAAQKARPVQVDEMPVIDLIVCGSVAVNPEGVRIGKGAGYADIELALLAEAGLLTEDTTIVTTVHELQVLDEPLPHRPHDFTVDYVLTPDRVITCGPAHRPAGIDWDELDADQIEAIPVLHHLAEARRLRDGLTSI
jgi:5-formyltetrahydrofolate cyclo-ligase